LTSHAAESAGRRLTQDHKLAGKRVLIVEDEPLIAMVLADYLTEAGCQVVGPAQRLEAAQTLIDREEFDGALVDGNLAGKPVTELALALTRKRVPFVFVTGYGREALPPGFHDAPMIEKPFTPEQVIAALERLFETGGNIVSLKRPSKRDA
jgi:DNA-binding response OmpR family regulator